ncbi:MAG: hypothetical protein ABL997_02950 [Planctomycetota bacterium]
MTHSSHEPGVRLRRQLRAQLRDGKETVSLTAAETELLLDEVGRLQQSNDRLRRQNKRLRRRLLSQGGVDMADIESEIDEELANSPDEDESV